MPTSAVTGTESMSTAGKRPARKTEKKTVDKAEKAPVVEGDASPPQTADPAPLADPSGNGFITSVKADGRIVSYDGTEDGVEKRVFEGTSKAEAS